MNMCSRNHDEIVHDERHCPLCEALDNIKTMEDDIGKLEEELAESQKERDEYQDKYNDLLDMVKELAPEVAIVI